MGGPAILSLPSHKMNMNHRAAALGAICLAAFATSAPAQDHARLALGEKVYSGTCNACHDTAKPPEGTPQLKDAADWKERYGNGRDVLYRNAIEGLRLYFDMPPKGGNPSLSDDEVKAAVDYMLDKAGVR